MGCIHSRSKTKSGRDSKDKPRRRRSIRVRRRRKSTTSRASEYETAENIVSSSQTGTEESASESEYESYEEEIEEETLRMFHIGRSMNRNITCYDANLTDNGEFDLEKPLLSYWEMIENGGSIEELNFIEKSKVYGYSVTKVENEATSPVLWLQLNALANKKLRLEMVDNKPRCYIVLNGEDKRNLWLRDVWAEMPKPYWRMKVDHLIVTCIDTNTGEEVKERIDK